MADFRRIEQALVDYFLGEEGFKVTNAGDVFAQRSGTCFLAQAGERCEGMGSTVINLTALAKTVAEKIGCLN